MKELICKFCKKCIDKNNNDKTIYPLFIYTNKPIVKKELIKNKQGWGQFPNKVWELTYEDGKIDYTGYDTVFSNVPIFESSSYIVRKSKPLEILSVYERLQNGYIVRNLSSEQFYYIPKYTDLLGLGNDKNYKHPKLLPTQPQE